MFNPENQYRCDIIRSKSTKQMDDLLPAYASIISELCPINSKVFRTEIRDKFSYLLFENSFDNLGENNQKTVDNHRTEIASKLFGMYYEKDGVIYESETTSKLLEDNDQPAFFKNLCLNFQFPNGTQSIKTISERVYDGISLKPFHFIISLLNEALKAKTTITKTEVAYYVLNSLDVLQGKVNSKNVLDKIIDDRSKGLFKEVKLVKNQAWTFQHISGQLNLLLLANLIRINGDTIYLNNKESETINKFLNELSTPLSFDINSYNLGDKEDRKLMYQDWAFYYSRVDVSDYDILTTSIEALQQDEALKPNEKVKKKGINHNILGDEGEEYVYRIEKSRVTAYNPRLANKVIMLGKQRGIGYDISSVEANENIQDPEFARFIEVKSTKRTTVPSLDDKSWVDTINLTRKEWVAAKQYKMAYNIYRVYFTPNETIIRK
ncbi:DUF3883 domain-containing protein, partial [Saprospiraceae bacterium]|nr:DUF3883 domain-containing protein [Saprospiraceae bacterium]